MLGFKDDDSPLPSPVGDYKGEILYDPTDKINKANCKSKCLKGLQSILIKIHF